MESVFLGYGLTDDSDVFIRNQLWREIIYFRVFYRVFTVICWVGFANAMLKSFEL